MTVVAVIGLGYVGLPLAVAFGRSAADAALGGQVIPAKQLEDLAK